MCSLAILAAAFAGAANPLFEGWYADPQIRRFGDSYWIYPTYSHDFKEQTFMDVFSSKDLRTWTKHPQALTTNEVKWAKGAMWAPDAQEKDGRYYLFFAANDAYPVGGKRADGEPQTEPGIGKYGGIGVAVADRPEGPYRDLIGKPLIDRFWNAAQPIDQYVFRHKDDWYMVYGGWGKCNLVRLAPDFKSLVPFEDGRLWRDITPPGYTEGSVMFERKGVWYFMYSGGGWVNDTYCVKYCTAPSPFGPFEFRGVALSSQRPIATGAGHHSVLNIPGTDDWYICYHRRPIPNQSRDHRVTCLDRMYFNADGSINPVVMTKGSSAELPPLVGDGVQDDTAAIQARLDSGAACVYLPPPEKCYRISKTLRIGSDTELRLDRFSVIRLAPGSDCPMIENKGYVGGDDRRIALTGGIWDMANVDQSPNPQQYRHCKPPREGGLPPKHENDFFFGMAMRFSHVEGMTVKGVTVRNPTSYGMAFCHTSYFLIDDIAFDYKTCNPIFLNMDGVHLDGWCHHGRISNLRGNCFDDLVALNANDGQCAQEEGDITDVDIDGVYADYCHSAVRLLSTGANLKRVTIRNVHGNFYTYAVGLTHFFGARKTRGVFDDIVISDVFMGKVFSPENIGAHSRTNFPSIWVEGAVDVGSLTISNFNRDERNVPVSTIRVDAPATIGRLTVRDCKVINRLKEPLSFFDIHGKIGELVSENNTFIASPGEVRDVRTPFVTTNGRKVFRAGDRVAWIGDSITSCAHRLPHGYITTIEKAAKETVTPGFDDIIGLGFPGWHVYSWHAYERRSLKEPSLGSRFPRVPTLGDVFTNRLDVIVLALGINDHGFPTFADDDLAPWEAEYDRFISDLRERCHPRQFILCNVTTHTADPSAAANRRLERMNERIAALAKRHGALLVDFRTSAWRAIERVRQMKTGLRDLEDLIHPKEIGHAEMARDFCRAVGETKMAEWLGREVERRYAALEATLGGTPRLVCGLRQDRTENHPGVRRLSYDIPWNLVGATGASVSVALPAGWQSVAKTLSPSNGLFRVIGCPDHLVNPIVVTARLKDRVVTETVPVPAPWLVSADFAFPNAWKGANWQTNAVPPIALDGVEKWALQTPTWDFAGDVDPGALDLRSVNTGYPMGAAYICRRLYAPRAMKLKLVLGTTFWSAQNGVRIWLDGKLLAETLLHSGWEKGKPFSCADREFPVKLESGWHDLVLLTANREFDHYFHCRILDAATGKVPADLQIASEPVTHVNPVFAE